LGTHPVGTLEEEETVTAEDEQAVVEDLTTQAEVEK